MAVRDKDRDKKRPALKGGGIFARNPQVKIRADDGGIQSAIITTRVKSGVSGGFEKSRSNAAQDPPLSLEESQRRFDAEIAKAREKQIAWIEAMGPPDGWVKVADLSAQGWIRADERTVDSSPLQVNTDAMAEMTDYSKELQLRDDQLRRDMAAQRELAEERMKGFDDRMKAFMDNQSERDKRIEDIAARATKAAESAATVKSNYWAAVGVQLLAVAAILVGAYFATQANTLSAITTTLSAYQAGKTEGATPPPAAASPAPPTSAATPSGSVKP